MTQQDVYVGSQEEFTEDTLMEGVLSKYKILIESDKWNAPSDQDTKIIALTAEIHALKLREVHSTKEKKSQVNC